MRAEPGDRGRRDGMAGNSSEPGRTVTSKVAAILLELGSGRESSLSDLARQTGMPVSTVFRLLQALASSSMVERPMEATTGPGRGCADSRLWTRRPRWRRAVLSRSMTWSPRCGRPCASAFWRRARSPTSEKGTAPAPGTLFPNSARLPLHATAMGMRRGCRRMRCRRRSPRGDRGRGVGPERHDARTRDAGSRRCGPFHQPGTGSSRTRSESPGDGKRRVGLRSRGGGAPAAPDVVAPSARPESDQSEVGCRWRWQPGTLDASRFAARHPDGYGGSRARRAGATTAPRRARGPTTTSRGRCRRRCATRAHRLPGRCASSGHGAGVLATVTAGEPGRPRAVSRLLRERTEAEAIDPAVARVLVDLADEPVLVPASHPRHPPRPVPHVEDGDRGVEAVVRRELRPNAATFAALKNPGDHPAWTATGELRIVRRRALERE